LEIILRVTMKFTIARLLAMLATAFTAIAAENDIRVFEMRTYHAAPGKLDALNARFREHTTKLFEKHGMTNIGYWVPVDNKDNLLIYVLAFPSRDAAKTSWKAFMGDPDWQKASKASEVDGKLVEKADSVFMTATDFSPELKLSADGDRLFELRTYTTPPGKLPDLHARFRDHTIALFKKHGMTNLIYWQLLPDQPNAETTLIYLLAHKDAEAAKASFAAFRADPEWVTVKDASEKKAGGSLTLPDGVKSVMMKATDYSPIR
jgi:NIPSNAP